MVPLSTPGDVLRWWRSEVLDLGQQQVAELLQIQPTALSNWENGTRAITVDHNQIDHRLNGGGTLANLLWACTTPAGLEPRRRWSGVFPRPSTPVWLWVRSQHDQVRVEAEWGVVRIEPTVDLGPNGAFLVIGSSMSVWPLVVHLDRPGWVDLGRGELPDSVPGAPVIPAVNLIRRSSARGAFMQLFLGNLNDKFSGTRQRSRELAALAMMAPRAVTSFLSGLGRPSSTESPGAWPPVVEDVPEATRPDFARLRAARGLSLAETTQLLEEETGLAVGKDTLRRFESDVGRPYHDLLPAALDHVLGANGHLCRVALATGHGPGVVRFPPFWRGPVWLAFEGDEGCRRIELRWSDWRRTLTTNPPLLTTFVCTRPDSPLTIRVDDDLRWTIGLGRLPRAQAIDQDWMPASVAAAQHALGEAERALLTAIRASQPLSTR